MTTTFALALALTFGSLLGAAHAAEPSHDANQVAALMGLDKGEYRELSKTEAQAVRGTGGYYRGGLLGLGLNANVRANVNVLNLLGVRANVFARVRL